MLSTWIERSKEDSASSRSKAAQLLARIRAAQEEYALGEFESVADHLAAIRAWILEGSMFELH